MFYETEKNKPAIYWALTGLWTVLVLGIMSGLSLSATKGSYTGFLLTLLFAMPCLYLTTLWVFTCGYAAHRVMEKDPSFRTTAADWADPRDIGLNHDSDTQQ